MVGKGLTDFFNLLIYSQNLVSQKAPFRQHAFHMQGVLFYFHYSVNMYLGGDTH